MEIVSQTVSAAKSAIGIRPIVVGAVTTIVTLAILGTVNKTFGFDLIDAVSFNLKSIGGGQ